MRKIKSFRIDHTKLTKGVYVSRVDRVGMFSRVTTFDVRMKTPYKEEALNPAAAHAIEHCLATFLRNTRRDIVYAGPMGCMTGFYVLVKGKKKVADIVPSLREAFEWMQFVDDIPGSTMKECGNYTFMDIVGMRREAAAFCEAVLR